MLNFLKKALRLDARDRYLKHLTHQVAIIGGLEREIAAQTDEELARTTEHLRQRLGNGQTLDAILPLAFAAVREAARRTLNKRHYDVQLLGGIILHDGHLTEMRTGEGKTLVAALPAYLNALTGEGVHIVTTNDYLAARDAAETSRIFLALGMTVGCVQHGLEESQRKLAYACDVTYCTNHEVAFDYLRDNMKNSRDAMVQRDFNFAIVDEVDSILIDEARTPLIISGPADDASNLCMIADVTVALLKEGEHYEIDRKTRSVSMTDAGNDIVDAYLREAGVMPSGHLYDAENFHLSSHVLQALRAHTTYRRDKDYLVRNNQVMIVDEYTGRAMPGRRYSDGLHQALEAKEKVAIQRENVTLASVTLQNFFRMYKKLSGMTGTAMTEAKEFGDIYGLAVFEVPTNLPVARIDHDDDIYLTAAERDAEAVKLLLECYQRHQPVLVGTASIDKSHQLSHLLTKAGVPHNVLNAHQHEHEAKIVAQAGRPGMVTIATNMAGRGTDIKLGGDLEKLIAEATWQLTDEVQRTAIGNELTKRHEGEREIATKAGGLYVVGVERNDSRRIDNQLRGRSGRQGDPGASKFFLSLEDELLRVLSEGRGGSILKSLGLEAGTAITHPMVTRAIGKAQAQREGQHFDVRKELIKYDDVFNAQRKSVYSQRLDVIDCDDASEVVAEMRQNVVKDIVAMIPAKSFTEQWDWDVLQKEAASLLAVDLPVDTWKSADISVDEFSERLTRLSDERYAAQAALVEIDVFRAFERQALIQVIDEYWQRHIALLDQLRQSIGLRSYGQRNPLHEFQAEAFAMYKTLLSTIQRRVTAAIHNVRIEVKLVDPALAEKVAS